MNAAMGMTSASMAAGVAMVWNAKEPRPTATTTAISASVGQSRPPVRRHNRKAAAAAMRKAALLSAFVGSAQNAPSRRSQ